MGEIVDLGQERAKRQAQKDREAPKLALPRPAPLIDQDWDNELGRLVETVHVPPYYRDRDFGDEA